MPAQDHRSPVEVSPANGRAARVLQITDPHLMADTGGSLLGVRTRDSLDAVVKCARQHYGQPDLLLATGDLAQDASETAYHEFARQVSVFGCRGSWVAGNHDDSELLTEIAQHYRSAGRHLLVGQWQVIMLDSAVKGQVHGYLEPDELAFLEDALATYPGRPALISLHHHPVELETQWMNPIGLTNREAFWSIIDRFENVRAVLWGHIHQDLDLYRGDVRLLATPSTCIQFEAGSTDFSVERQAPGFRWLDLGSDGTIDTGVVRATDFRYDLDTDSTGY